jgi:putative ABC transport system substrate-binding protein
MPMLNRRAFLGAAFAVAAGAARAQEARRRPKIGVLWHAASVEEEGKCYTALVQSLRTLGYEHGRTAEIEHRFPAEQQERFERYAQELVASDVDVLIAVTQQAAIAAKRATSSIPIVFLIVPNPIGAGLVASLAAPGGNATGISTIATDLTAKRLQLFKEAIGDISKVAVLVNPDDPVTAKTTIADLEAAGAALNISILPFEVRARDQLGPTLARVAESGAGGFLIAQNPVFFNERRHIADIAIQHRLPSMHVNNDAVEAGILMSYGANFEAMFRRATVYVDRILKGAEPRSLPIEQPTQFELVVNLATARRFGLTVAPSVLVQADRLIDA